MNDDDDHDGGIDTPTAAQLAVRDDMLRVARRAFAALAVLVLLATTLALRSPADDPAATQLADSSLPGERTPGSGNPSELAAGGAGPDVTSGTEVGAGEAGAAGGDGAGTDTSGGRARSGVECTSGARQVTWSRYAPACRGEFAGSNGGATSPGVTDDTITLSYRRQGTAQAATVRSLAGEATPVDAEYLHDLQVFVNLFNANYELYGRQVELAPFNGKGDYLTEDLGQGQQAANADGITARELGAFADITFPSATSPFYSAALQSQGVISYGFPLAPQSWYEQNSPWQYNVFLSGTSWAGWATNLVCQRLGEAPAVFAGDDEINGTPRVYGLVAVEFPTWLQTADEIADGIQDRCGIEMARRASYAEDLGSMQQDGNAIAAQMKSAGVTTLICFCDPLMPIFLTDAATRQEYQPEWVFQNQFDPIAQVTDQSQFAHAIAPGPVQHQRDASEAYAAYKLADPTGEPASIYFAVAYEVLLHIFGVIHSAGPVLTPESFRAGAFSLPASLGPGEFGSWGSGPGHYTPTDGVGIVWWDPQAVSANGKQGSWQACEGGRVYSFEDPAAWGHGPLACFR